MVSKIVAKFLLDMIEKISYGICRRTGRGIRRNDFV